MLFPYQIELTYNRRPWVTYALLVLNVCVFLGTTSLANADRTILMYEFGYTPDSPSLLTMITAMFLHAGWLHLVGNMYMLWLFGRAIEDALGPVRYLVFYVAAGLTSMAVHTALTLPVVADVPCIGASGAIAGVLGAYLALYPTIRVHCVILLFEFRPIGTAELHAAFVLGIWFLLQLILQDALGGNTGATGVAYAAHIGGFVFGWVLFAGIQALSSAGADWGAIQWTRRLRHAAMCIERDVPVPETEAAEPVVKRMQFLKRGVEPEPPAHLTDWIHDLDPQSDAALIASLACRSVAQDPPAPGLTPHAAARGAAALARLDHPRHAARLLLDRLEHTSGIELQPLLYELGNLLQATPAFQPVSRQCMELVVALDAGSPLGQSASYALQDMPS